MTMRWQLWDKDFHSDVVCDNDLFLDEVNDEIVVCLCYGRGKTQTDLELPRLPRCYELRKKIEECPLPFLEMGTCLSEKKGRGRGKLLRKQDQIRIGRKVRQEVGENMIEAPSVCSDTNVNPESCEDAVLPQIQIPKHSKISKPDPRIVGFGRPPEKKRVVETWTESDFPVLGSAASCTSSADNMLIERKAETSDEMVLTELDEHVLPKDGRAKKIKRSWKHLDMVTQNEHCVPTCVKKAISRKIKLQYSESETNVPTVLEHVPSPEFNGQQRSEMFANKLFSVMSKSKERYTDGKNENLAILEVACPDSVDVSIEKQKISLADNHSVHGLDNDEEIASYLDDVNIEKKSNSLVDDDRVEVMETTEGEDANTDEMDVEKHGAVFDPLSITSNCWNMTGKCIIQVSGLPAMYDLTAIQDLIGTFGTILDMEQQSCDDISAVRFKLNSPEKCDFAVSCLHDADCLFPDTNRIIECYRVS